MIGSLHDLTCEGPMRCTCNSIAIRKPTPKPRKAPSRLRSKPNRVPPFIREAVLRRDGYLCQWCKQSGGALDPHHRLARSQGGKDTYDNLVSLHRICHSAVHANPSEARRRGLIVATGAKSL